MKTKEKPDETLRPDLCLIGAGSAGLSVAAIAASLGVLVVLVEAEARERHGAIRILRWSFSENDRARAEGATEGHVKAVVTPRGKILGCTIAGAHAGELIMPWVLALTKGLKVSDLAGLVYPYPTFSEVTKSTAVEFLKPSAQNPWVRRAIGLLRRLG